MGKLKMAIFDQDYYIAKNVLKTILKWDYRLLLLILLKAFKNASIEISYFTPEIKNFGYEERKKYCEKEENYWQQ